MGARDPAQPDDWAEDTCWGGPPGPRNGGHTEDPGVLPRVGAPCQPEHAAQPSPPSTPTSQRWVPLGVKGSDSLPRSLSSWIFTGQCGGVARRSPGLPRPVSSLARSTTLTSPLLTLGSERPTRRGTWKGIKSTCVSCFCSGGAVGPLPSCAGGLGWDFSREGARPGEGPRSSRHPHPPPLTSPGNCQSQTQLRTGLCVLGRSMGETTRRRAGVAESSRVREGEERGPRSREGTDGDHHPHLSFPFNLK